MDKIIKTYIIFEKEFEDFWNAKNKQKENLGYLKYERIGRFKHWCWYQYQDIRMSPGCIQEVRDTQKLLKNKQTHTNSQN